MHKRSIHSLVTYVLAGLLLAACDKTDKKSEEKSSSKEESAKGSDKKTEKNDKSEKAETTTFKVKANFEEYDGTYDFALAEYSGMGFRIYFGRDCKLSCNEEGFLDDEKAKKDCKKGYRATVTVPSKTNVIPPVGTYDTEDVDLHGYADSGNSHVPHDKKNKLTLTSSSKTEVAGTVDIESESENYGKGSFKAKVCVHKD